MKEIDDRLGNYEREEEGNTISYEYNDAYEHERIEIERETNKYGVTQYKLRIEYYHRDNEITNPIVCGQHCYDCEGCTYYQNGECTRSESDIRSEINDWENRKRIRVDSGLCKITIYNRVIEEDCYLNIPHTHLFKGIIIEVETYDLKQLISVIELRDILRGIHSTIQ